MKRLILIAAIFLASFITFATVPNPTRVQAAAGCGFISGGNGATVTFIPIIPGSFSFTITGSGFVISHDNFGGPGPWPSISLPWSVPTFTWVPGTTFETFTFQTTGSWSMTYCGMTPAPAGGAAGGVILPFMDGRCNQQADQTVAVYPDGKGGYYLYAIYQGVGYFAFRVSEQNLDDNPAKSANYLIAHNLNVWLYRLTDGSLLATGIKPDGKLYSFIIGSCGAMED